MEHNTIKKIVVGLFFCLILFVVSFFVEENSTKLNQERNNAPVESFTADKSAVM